MVKGVLLDLSGVLYVGDSVIPGAVEAIDRLRQQRLPFCFITNTSRRSRHTIQQSLQALGFDVEEDDILTAASATLDYVEQHQLKPHVLVHENLKEEFSALQSAQANCVVLGDAAQAFTYANLNRAFRVLMKSDDVALISMGYNRYFQEADGLSLDLGAFTSALEFASGKKAIIMGKPSKDFFLQAVNKLGCEASQVMMIGDDVESDINGALQAGLQACLVKTGKYRPADEERMVADALVVENVNRALEQILSQTP
jgi:HAD superfamily hydrolase (TIGR01458 family)